ncbi:MAG: hypothetical protein AVDCRST_MAG64-2767 [uncultured Phycisphaerae bacterium]|uniref:Uncharacterized protein n=1 Tax=uncultured Phycisphaerae bacterium TaxID=904963 RepID=A0A6J4PL90_9BACT|nr:MAG: hypothetical protein AVDCRST_MAG64-2767 [uncultured Phycisphaerae bacterium]
MAGRGPVQVPSGAGDRRRLLRRVDPPAGAVGDPAGDRRRRRRLAAHPPARRPGCGPPDHEVLHLRHRADRGGGRGHPRVHEPAEGDREPGDLHDRDQADDPAGDRARQGPRVRRGQRADPADHGRVHVRLPRGPGVVARAADQADAGLERGDRPGRAGPAHPVRRGRAAHDQGRPLAGRFAGVRPRAEPGRHPVGRRRAADVHGRAGGADRRGQAEGGPGGERRRRAGPDRHADCRRPEGHEQDRPGRAGQRGPPGGGGRDVRPRAADDRADAAGPAGDVHGVQPAERQAGRRGRPVAPERRRRPAGQELGAGQGPVVRRAAVRAVAGGGAAGRAVQRRDHRRDADDRVRGWPDAGAIGRDQPAGGRDRGGGHVVGDRADRPAAGRRGRRRPGEPAGRPVLLPVRPGRHAGRGPPARGRARHPGRVRVPRGRRRPPGGRRQGHAPDEDQRRPRRRPRRREVQGVGRVGHGPQPQDRAAQRAGPDGAEHQPAARRAGAGRRRRRRGLRRAGPRADAGPVPRAARADRVGPVRRRRPGRAVVRRQPVQGPARAVDAGHPRGGDRGVHVDVPVVADRGRADRAAAARPVGR